MKNVVIFSDDTELRDLVRQLDDYQVLYFSTQFEVNNLPNDIDLAIFDFDVVPLSLMDEWLQFPRLHIRIFAIVSSENLYLIDEVVDRIDGYSVRPLSDQRLQLRLNDMYKNNAASIVIGIASSEHGSPLRSIAGMADVILQELGVSEDGISQFLSIIQNNAKQIHDNLYMLRDWIRIEFGRQYHFSQFNIVKILDFPDINNKLSKKSQVLAKLIPDNLSYVYADESKISFVIQAILDNATKYSNDNTVIQIGFTTEHDYLVCLIKDEGIGIWETDYERIFEQFGRSIFVQERYWGIGLNLYLCKQIIEMHGGKIWFESEVGVGTTFYFTLPLAE